MPQKALKSYKVPALNDLQRIVTRQIRWGASEVKKKDYLKLCIQKTQDICTIYHSMKAK